MGTYSFLSVQATISGPGGTFPIGSGAGAAEEGITSSMAEDKDTLTIGASGESMHSLHGGNAGRVTVRILKTSPVNALLSALYNFQRSNAGNWGQNTIVISDTVRGDIITASACAFTKHPDVTYAKEGGSIEWVFNAGTLIEILGVGVPNVNG